MMKKNSIFIFMAGDNNLDASGNKDIREMCRSNLSPEVNVVVQFDRRKGWLSNEPTKRFRIEKHQVIPEQDIGETNCGDPTVLTGFLTWGTSSFPADRNIVVLWDHGGGVDDRNPYAPARWAGLFSSKPAGKKEGKIYLKAICHDDTSRDFLTNAELRKALKDTGKRYSILAFDACLMNMFEIVYQVRDLTDIVIGSEDIEPGNGWSYEPVLNHLSADPDADTRALARQIVRLYEESYPADINPLTQSAIATDGLEDAARALDAFAVALLGSMGTVRPALPGILKAVQRFYQQDFIDLYDFALRCRKTLPDKPIADSAARLLAQMDRIILENIHVGRDVTGAHGLSIYFPQDKPDDAFLDPYRTLEFTTAYPGWLDLITKYYTPLAGHE
jgi:hypothetical protein